LPTRDDRVLVYADGSCIGNPGPGGWGVVIIEPDGKKREFSGSESKTTNNRMEITAAIEALRALEPGASVTLRSDSQYVVNTMMQGWKRRMNQDLWAKLDAETAKRKVRFEWVMGHATDPLNDRADELARTAATKGTDSSPPYAKPAKPDRSGTEASETELLARIESLLTAEEAIARCEACGRLFVAPKNVDSSKYCLALACQLKARLGRSAPSTR
jgi:ribonuclease HI